MATFIVESLDGIVGHQVAVGEEQSVDTQTVGQLELIVDGPVILCIDTRTVELHTGSRRGLAIVTVGQTEDLRSLVKQLLNGHTVFPVVTIVTGTITHVLVVGHLMLEGDTSHDLVLTHIVSHIVLEVPNGVVHSVVPGEQLITQGHVVVAVLRDINEGEFARIGTTDIIKLRDSSQELVRQVVGQTAVQVDRPRVHDVLHRVHGVGKRHRVLRHTATRHTCTTIHRRSVRIVPHIILRIIIAQSQMMAVCNVPVQTGQQLVVALVGREVGPATSIIAVFLAHVV